jgi:uncharacterized OsmC-like protein
MRNGIPVAAISEFTNMVKEQPSFGEAKFGVSLQWQSGTRTAVRTLPATFVGQKVNRDFSWQIDEPKQIGGTNHAPSPQEMLLSAFASCMVVTYVVGASMKGIQLSRLEIDVQGELDLAGFLGLNSEAVKLKGINYTLYVAGDGTPEQFEELRKVAQAHSPNAMTLSAAVPVSGCVAV